MCVCVAVMCDASLCVDIYEKKHCKAIEINNLFWIFFILFTLFYSKEDRILWQWKCMESMFPFNIDWIDGITYILFLLGHKQAFTFRNSFKIHTLFWTFYVHRIYFSFWLRFEWKHFFRSKYSKLKKKKKNRIIRAFSFHE